MTVGDRIKSLRVQHDMSQEELGVLLKTTKQTIFKYENNIVTNIPLDKIERLSEIWNISPAYIMGWMENPLPLSTCLTKAPASGSDLEKLSDVLAQLNEEGREKLLDYADDLVASGKYTKNRTSQLDQEA